MNYFERCKKRIENAKNIDIDADCIKTFSSMTKYVVDGELVLREFNHSGSQISYTVSFKDVRVPISEIEIKYLFELSEKKLKELINIENEEILRDL